MQKLKYVLVLSPFRSTFLTISFADTYVTVVMLKRHGTNVTFEVNRTRGVLLTAC